MDNATVEVQRCDEIGVPADWRAFGARWGSDGLLYLGEWRHGFTVHQLRTMFFECQQLRSLKVDVERFRLEAELQHLEVEAWKKRAAFYRDQLRLESTLGAMLTRITEFE